MALVSLNLKPKKKILKDFGDVGMAMLIVIGLIFFWRNIVEIRGLVVFCLVGLGLYTASRISTALVKPIYLTLIVVTFPIGWLISHLVMAIFYYGIITPVALFFKLKKRDALYRSYDPKATTYWFDHDKKRTQKDYFNQT